MKEKPKPSTILHIVESVYSLVVLAWILVPLLAKSEGIMPTAFLPFRAPDGKAPGTFAAIFWAIAVFLPGLVAVFKLAAYFLEDALPVAADPRRPIAAGLGILESALAIAAIVAFIIEFARGQGFFAASSPLLYLTLFLSIAFNAYSIYLLIVTLSRRDEAYQEYLQYRQSNQKKETIREIIFKQGIQKRLILSFVPLILVIIVILSFILMTNFSRTILSSVIENAKQIADSTANVVKANPTEKDQIAVDDYLRAAAKKNEASTIPFHDITYYRRDSKTNAFSVGSSTDQSLLGKSSAAKVTDAFTDTRYDYNPATKEYEFLAPVNLSKAFLGFVTVDYARDVIFEPYFRTQVKVVSVAAIFIYLSVFLIYLIGRNIVFPILYLRMSVAAISSSLAGMIKGEKRISAELLQFTDRIETRDEIKGLSSEVGNMTAVIRGIVPYISASTLKASERSTPSTELKDLCFLFTDIRGFTTLSEGMTPDKIVEMLNHYLDIQSSIILANHGDVDKFVGDETMAMFEGPDKELNAVRTSLAIRKTMAEEKEKAIAANMNVVSIGIGINSGPVAFGSVGAKDRMDFTSIGDTVNLAARLEGANKPYGTKTLVTNSVYEKVKEDYLCREIDMLAVKGKKLGVSVYEVVQAKDIAAAHLIELCKGFEEGLALYRAQKWAKAEKIFGQLAEKYKDEASSTFLGRIELFKSNPPPPDWDGVFVMTVK
jgi:class 3 adenylate cyclase